MLLVGAAGCRGLHAQASRTHNGNRPPALPGQTDAPEVVRAADIYPPPPFRQRFWVEQQDDRRAVTLYAEAAAASGGTLQGAGPALWRFGSDDDDPLARPLHLAGLPSGGVALTDLVAPTPSRAGSRGALSRYTVSPPLVLLPAFLEAGRPHEARSDLTVTPIDAEHTDDGERPLRGTAACSAVLAVSETGGRSLRVSIALDAGWVRLDLTTTYLADPGQTLNARSPRSTSTAVRVFGVPWTRREAAWRPVDPELPNRPF